MKKVYGFVMDRIHRNGESHLQKRTQTFVAPVEGTLS